MEETIYTYTDAYGAWLFDKVRQEENGHKKFTVRRKLQGTGESLFCEMPPTLYNLPGVIRAIAERKIIWFNEGEKGADTFSDKGETGTCLPLPRWVPPQIEILAGSLIAQVVDRDARGLEFARETARVLDGVCAQYQAYWPATTEERSDAFDHFAAGFGIEDFVPIDLELLQ